MSDTDKTHYRKAFDSPYLGAADVVDPIVLTIRRVTLEKDRTKKTPDQFNTAHFVEREIRPGEALKPMILNATNSKMLASLSGSKWIEDWAGLQVTVYVDPHVSFGREKVEGLRLAKAADKPKAAPPALIEAATAAAKKGLAAYAEWFKAAGPENRLLLAARHVELKRIAAEAEAGVDPGADDPRAVLARETGDAA